MPETVAPPERIDLSRADDPRDVVHRSVAALAQGGVVGLATETGYGLCAGALHAAAIGSLAEVADRLGSGPPTLLLKGAEELSDWVPNLGALSRRLARRAWPGPVVLRFPGPTESGLLVRLSPTARGLLMHDGALAVRIPEQPFIREVLRLIPGPLLMLPLQDETLTRLADATPHCPLLSLIVDEGMVQSLAPATVVRIEDDRWRIESPGAVDEATLHRLAGTILLFVCTGNTCRSPMAEALCKVLLAERLGCSIGELEQQGYVVLSAGIAAGHGMPAAAHAIDVVRHRGGSLQAHQSRQVTIELIRHADVVIALTNDHLEALLDRVPDAAPYTRLLHPEGGDVPDPVGLDRETYQRTARVIESFLGRLLDDLGIPGQPA